LVLATVLTACYEKAPAPQSPSKKETVTKTAPSLQAFHDNMKHSSEERSQGLGSAKLAELDPAIDGAFAYLPISQQKLSLYEEELERAAERNAYQYYLEKMGTFEDTLSARHTQKMTVLDSSFLQKNSLTCASLAIVAAEHDLIDSSEGQRLAKANIKRALAPPTKPDNEQLPSLIKGDRIMDAALYTIHLIQVELYRERLRTEPSQRDALLVALKLCQPAIND